MSTLSDIMNLPMPSPEDLSAARSALGSPFPYQLGWNMDLAVKIVALLRQEARKAGMLRAASIAAMFSINKTPIHPDVPWSRMTESAQMITHMTAQNIAEAIRSEARALEPVESEKEMP